MTNFCYPCFTATHSTHELSTHSSVPGHAWFLVNDGKLSCSHCALFGWMREKKVVDLERVERVEREIKESGILKNSMEKVTSALGRCQM